MAHKPRVAYFCMEYGLDASLPLYAGGLGVLAGDMMKAVGDLKAPLVGIGLFWSEGYGQQRIGKDGKPGVEYRPVPRDVLEKLDVSLEVEVGGKAIALTAFRVTRHTAAELYLLEPTDPKDRWITKRLYGGGDDDRVSQEVLLGVGGVRLLRALGKEVDVYHFNEGHAVFAGLELIRERRVAGSAFMAAWQAVREEIVFTTHTPVPAGNEEHDPDLILRIATDLGITRDELIEIGGDPFGMTVAGLRLARAANGVAQLHGETARKMWKHVTGGAPIDAITNGVHVPTWQDERIRAAGTDHGKLERAHQEMKKELCAAVKERNGVDLRDDRLIVGFARRAAPYKRADLIFGEPEKLEPLFRDQRLQLCFSGKAHPKDTKGQVILSKLVEASRKWPNAVVFLEDYDMRLGALLTRGCDIWLNNPRRPKEASGTSGMKAAMNGVLNLSIADGWWPEGCVHGETGWQIGTPAKKELPDAELDKRDRAALYTTLLEEVVPLYYDDRAKWLGMMEKSIAMSQQRFSAARMVEEYYARLYSAS